MVHGTVDAEKYRLSRSHVANQPIAEHVQRHALRGKDTGNLAARLPPLAEHQRPDAEGIPERENPVTDDHHDHRVRPPASSVDAAHRVEDVVRRGAQTGVADGRVEFVGEHVQQDLRVGVGVDVSQVFPKHRVGEFARVREVSVVTQCQAEGRIDVERLRLGAGVATRGGVAHVANAHGALQLQHVAGMKYVANQAVVLAQKNAFAVAGNHSGGVLAAVLKHREPVVEFLIGGAGPYDSYNSTHDLTPRLTARGELIGQHIEGLEKIPVIEIFVHRLKIGCEN